MGRYCQCGEIVVGAKCTRCGRAASDSIVAGAHAKAVGTDTKGANRDTWDKKGESWTAFGTNAQKTEGIDHTEAMARIDKYVAEGVEEEELEETGEISKFGIDINKLMANNGVTKKGENMIRKFDPTKPMVVKKGGGGVGGPTTTTTTVTETHFKMEGSVTKEGPISRNTNKFGKQNDGGADFMSQWKDKDAAKYKPGYANKNGGVL